MGLDYLVDDVALEINFNIQLGEASAGLGECEEKGKLFYESRSTVKRKNNASIFKPVFTV